MGFLELPVSNGGTMNGRFFLGIGFLAAIGIAAFAWRSRHAREAAAVFSAVGSPMRLNGDQRREVPAIGGRALPVFRVREADGTWRTFLGEAPASATLIGLLDEKPTKGLVDVPIFVCAWKAGGGESRSLDADRACSGGKLVAEAGYLAKGIRTGFRLLVRCRSRKSGLYLSLNARCESPADQADAVLGAIRAPLVD